MNLALTTIASGTDATALPVLIQRAAAQLASATNAAEVLEARDTAAFAYDTAKAAARFARVTQAHDEVLAAVRRALADALVIETAAKQRLGDEIASAKQRGEVATGSVRTDIVPNGNDVRPATAAEIGLTRKDIHEARQIRDAEVADPGIVRRTVDAAVAQGREPTRADVTRAVATTLESAPAAAVTPSTARQKRRGPIGDDVYKLVVKLAPITRRVNRLVNDDRTAGYLRQASQASLFRQDIKDAAAVLAALVKLTEV